MTVNGFPLPDSFLHAVASGSLRHETGAWLFRSNRDAFGRELAAELHEVYETAAEIERQTVELPIGFEPNGVYGESPGAFAGPGVIPNIVDFRGVLCFGMSYDDAPFCFDYRSGAREPLVIWWADCYWRVVAPDFATFLSLLDRRDA